ncbi:hypothetical protein L6164_023935 [Bauhinia variegata]|uniref:Uncharacterized protein n=1 Tax=Bauhinia variegata TaxID=167791 RepID=A0ACB9MLJ0_BAUVA|nr:hypothetical protein L6164_023935 [Bauhinia variegata]
MQNVMDAQWQRYDISSELNQEILRLKVIELAHPKFHPGIHDYIQDVIDMQANENCGYQAVGAILGLGGEKWA